MTVENSELTRIFAHVDKLVNECLVLEMKEEALRKKRQTNDREIRLLVLKAKKLSMEAMSEGNDDKNPDDPNVEESLMQNNNQEMDDEGLGASFEEYMQLKNKLLEEIKTSGNNLKDHHEVLDTIERENGRGSVAWKNMYKQVREYTRVHRLFKESRVKRIQEIESQLRGSSGHDHENFNDNINFNEATSSRIDNDASVSRQRTLNESVLDCGRMVKKIPPKELAAITPQKLKVENDSPEAKFVCNFDYCLRTFTCASSLVSHLENHYSQDQARIDCPFPGCKFSHTKENLTTHMRARHTGEKLFSCQFCPTKFHTMVAKLTHEKKHSQNDIWAQCNKQHCLKFYQVARGNCKSCGKK